MPRKNESILAIDVGSTNLKLCCGTLTPDGFTVERLIETPLPPNTVREGLVLEPDVAARGLRTALNQAGVRQRSALVAVGGPQATARPVRLPPMTPDALRKSIQYEAARYLPSAAEEHLIGFEILHSAEDHLEVLLVAAPRSVVDSVIGTLEQAGIEVELVEIQPFASLRTVHALWQAAMPHVFALLDIGGTHTQISVVRGGTLVLTRYIPIAGETLTAALKGYFHFSDEEANQIKRSLNLEELLQTGVPQENPPLRLVQPILDELIREIRRSLNYYQSQVQTNKTHEGRIETAVLTGGGALMQGITPYFEHRLGIPAQLFNPFEKDSAFLQMGLIHPEQRE
ncbi:MAG: type IV pilus assembly protein PilM, partial [Fimbriimonadales bacterium]|nr:type IV pilus assembly protein PilM [Fimbriimonadales bacterium]